MSEVIEVTDIVPPSNEELLRMIMAQQTQINLAQSKITELKNETTTMESKISSTDLKIAKLERTLTLTNSHVVLQRRSITTFGILVFLVETIDPTKRQQRVPVEHSTSDHYWKQALTSIVTHGLGEFDILRATNPAFRHFVNKRSVELLNDAVYTQERHDRAHPERDEAQLLSDALAIERYDMKRKDGAKIGAVLRPFVATLGRKRFLDLVKDIKDDAGATYEPVEDVQIKEFGRMFGKF